MVPIIAGCVLLILICGALILGTIIERHWYNDDGWN